MFSVTGIPKGQPRARAFARKMGVTETGEPKFVARMYDAGTAESWKQQVALACTPPDTPIEGPVCIELDFYLPRPKKISRRKDFSGPVPCTSKPDIDNLAKAVLDAMTTIGWWHDDAQVASLRLEKFWASTAGNHVGVSIRLRTMNPLVTP
jgi:Holliday junction resolvase RusA-like endonuclease